MRGLLLTSVCLAVAAMAAPGLVERYVGGSGADGVAGRMQASAQESSADPVRPGYVEVAAENDGHFYVDAEMNFARVRLLVDTGATVTALRQSDAEAAGIRLIAADFSPAGADRQRRRPMPPKSNWTASWSTPSR